MISSPVKPEQVAGENSLTEGDLQISFESRLKYLDLIQDFSELVTRKLGFDEDNRYWIALSVREAVTNAIQHGNKMDERKRVWVRFEIVPEKIVIHVRDEGEGFDESRLPNPLDPENLLKPSGRGIFYVRSFMDDVRFRKLPEGGAEMRMEKRLNSKSEGEEHEN